MDTDFHFNGMHMLKPFHGYCMIVKPTLMLLISSITFNQPINTLVSHKVHRVASLMHITSMDTRAKHGLEFRRN
jgi:hypothetical protein